jgi:hypothetical protein
MSKEDFVSYNVMRYLLSRRWSIFQYHAPGGQAAIHFDLADHSRVVPDVMGYRDDVLLIVECKGRYAMSDIAKLESMRCDATLVNKALALASRHAAGEKTPLPSRAVFAHACKETTLQHNHPAIGLIVVRNDGSVETTLPIH